MSLDDVRDTPTFLEQLDRELDESAEKDFPKMLYRDSSPRYGKKACWTYEAREGLIIVVQHYDFDGNKTRAFQYLKPWNALRDMVARMDR